MSNYTFIGSSGPLSIHRGALLPFAVVVHPGCTEIVRFTLEGPFRPIALHIPEPRRLVVVGLLCDNKQQIGGAAGEGLPASLFQDVRLFEGLDEAYESIALSVVNIDGASSVLRGVLIGG